MTPKTSKSLFAGMVVAALLSLTAGCTKYPEVTSKESLELLRALYTACSSESSERLTKVETKFQALSAAGALSQHEQETIARIIGKARAGDWSAAADDSYAYAKAQRR